MRGGGGSEGEENTPMEKHRKPLLAGAGVPEKIVSFQVTIETPRGVRGAPFPAVYALDSEGKLWRKRQDGTWDTLN